MCLSPRECSERGGFSVDVGGCGCVDGLKLKLKLKTTPTGVCLSPRECSERGGLGVDDIDGCVDGRYTDIHCILYRESIKTNDKSNTQECASPPESARREEVSAKAAAPLASVPAASSYPGQSLTRLLLGLLGNLQLLSKCH